MLTPDRPIATGWAVATATALGVTTLAVLPPFLGPEAGAVVHHAFSLVCHQLPDRSLHIGDAPVALCHRCLGITVGMAVGLLAAPLAGSPVLRAVVRGVQARWLVLAGLPTAVDWALEVLNLWANTPWSRTLTGALFGVVAGVILAANLVTPPRLAHPFPSPTPSHDA